MAITRAASLPLDAPSPLGTHAVNPIWRWKQPNTSNPGAVPAPNLDREARAVDQACPEVRPLGHRLRKRARWVTVVALLPPLMA